MGKKKTATSLAIELAQARILIENLEHERDEARTRIEFLEGHFNVTAVSQFLKCGTHPKQHMLVNLDGSCLRCPICVDNQLAQLRRMVIFSALDPMRFRLKIKPDIHLEELQPAGADPQQQIVVSEWDGKKGGGA